MAISLEHDRNYGIAEIDIKEVTRMRYRAIQSFFLGVFIGFTYELVRSIWQEVAQEAQEDLQKSKRSETTESYSRAGCDIWDLKPGN